ncbi:hypothetical protein PR003_g15757 [Phytophthora rubi]|uniref:Uncharacterized protein n=1 Tax=Phytophthora rubi TaxID=129364 RepID=A0A6A3KQP0_9STRA|nr:hypothetical protein PR002_g15624 [Phytophthora rubi]KAE9328569.1 hypothetical protein PR003_g15757 [Phytophthora rubi]
MYDTGCSHPTQSKLRWSGRPSTSHGEPVKNSEENQGAAVVAPPLQKTQFESWADLQDYLEVYEREHVPVNYAKTIVCTHPGKYKSFGKGIGKRQHGV